MYDVVNKRSRTNDGPGAVEFSDGWLERELARVRDEINGLRPEERPRLTGARAAMITEPVWLNPGGH